MCSENLELLKRTITYIQNKHEKEFYCHTQFVLKIGRYLLDRYGGNKFVVEVSCILHDIGNRDELAGDYHGESSMPITNNILNVAEICPAHKALILQCIKNHDGLNKPASIEERIVITADAISKLIYHEAFMLLCEKDTFRKRAQWGIKCLELAISRSQFHDYTTECLSRYKWLKAMYIEILNMRESSSTDAA